VLVAELVDALVAQMAVLVVEKLAWKVVALMVDL
jgi:hypothetical protein